MANVKSRIASFIGTRIAFLDRVVCGHLSISLVVKINMEHYPISPEDCLILRALNETRPLREAARLLACDPAGLQRKVLRISGERGLLHKIRGRWCLTAQGQMLAAWVEESIQSQKELLRSKVVLRLSATPWMAEQVLIPGLERLASRLGEATGFSFSSPRESFLSGSCWTAGRISRWLAIRPRIPRSRTRGSRPKSGWWSRRMGWQSGKGRPRPASRSCWGGPWSGTEINPDLILPGTETEWRPGVVVDSLIGVRAAVLGGLGWSFVPRILVREPLRGGQLVEIKHKIPMDREICAWWLRGRADSRRRSPVVCAWIKQVLAVDFRH